MRNPARLARSQSVARIALFAAVLLGISLTSCELLRDAGTSLMGRLVRETAVFGI